MNIRPTYSAPGKLVIAGEYAVLEGHEALSIAVDKRVKVSLSHGHDLNIDLSRNKLVACIIDSFQGQGNSLSRFGIEIDSSALHCGGSRSETKLGLGSSSAIAVSLCAALINEYGLDPSECFERALEAHSRFTNHKGSGIDVATSYYGGAIRYRRDGSKPIIDPFSLAFDRAQLLVVHTGVEQSTSALLTRIEPLKGQKRYLEIMAGIGQAAKRMIRILSLHTVSLPELNEAVAEHNFWMRALSQLAQARLLTKEHLQIEKVCDCFGGSAKPSGAGGGDISLCFIENTAREALEKEIRKMGFTPMAINFCASGLESH